MRGQQYYTNLFIGDQRWMTSNVGSTWDNVSRITPNCTGDVLIAGLGLGAQILLLQDREDVTSITVVEKTADVIDLVAPKFTNIKVSFIHGDIFNFENISNRRFDSVIFDIFLDDANLFASDKATLRSLDVLNGDGQRFFWHNWLGDFSGD